MNRASASASRLVRIVALAFFALACSASIVAIRTMTDGQFFYSLDDPYIHLALAEGIARGHHGINPGEFSSPSSSLLWPLLLAPFHWTPIGSLGPLLLNLVAGAVTAYLFGRMVEATWRPTSVRGRWLCAGLVVLLLLCANIVGLVFTGMEHSLQTMIVVAVLCGAVQTYEEGRAPMYAFVALAVGPWVRYECLAVTLPFAWYWWRRGHRRPVLIAVVTSLTGLSLFSLFLWSHGSGLLPDSVLAKELPAGSVGAVLWYKLGLIALRIGSSPQASALAVLTMILGAAALSTREPALRDLMIAMCASGAGHLLGGRFGAFNRYEAYIWNLELLGGSWLGARALHALRPRPTPAAWLAVYVAAIMALSLRFVYRTFATPQGSRDIYRQQHQLHRFAADFYRKPVAVNDLGQVAYRNEHFVLDLMGLASREVRLARRERDDEDWLDDLTRRHAVGLVMIYRHWFDGLPAHWIGLGRLTMPHATSVADYEVAFFATTPAAKHELEPLLARFAAQLPRDVHFVVDPSLK